MGEHALRVRAELDKAGKGYEVPIHPAVADVLRRRRARPELAASPTVLTGQAGRPTTPGNVAKAILRACARAGLPRPGSPTHHMRRSFGRWAVLGHLTGRPVPLYVVSRWMGHASVSVTETYLDLRSDESVDWMGVRRAHASAGQAPVSQ